MAPGDSSAGLGRLKPIVELFGPVPAVTDESDPLFMGADGHSSRFGILREEGIRAGINANRRLYSRRASPFIPAGPLPLFPQGLPFIPAGRAEGAVLPVLLLVAWYHGSMPPDPDAAGRGQRCFQCERRDSDSEPSKLGFFMFSLPVPA